MRNKIYIGLTLIWFLLVLVVTPLSAQKGLWYRVSGGVQDTYLRSWIRSEIDAKHALRPVTFFNLEYQFSSGASVQSGIGYSLYTQNTSKFKNNLNYLAVRITVQLTI
jgi:hypothetical protein